jgi:hypothetical protein
VLRSAFACVPATNGTDEPDQVAAAPVHKATQTAKIK